MGAVKSKLVGWCDPRCSCCGRHSESYTLQELPRPPQLNSGKDVIDGTRQGVLAIQGIDFCFDSNGVNHHTHRFNLMTRPVDRCLVIRRGQSFQLDLLLNRPYDPSKDAVSFVFYVADVERRGPSSETTASVALLEKGTEPIGGWSAVYQGQIDLHLMVSVTPAVDCVVATWMFDIDTKLADGPSLSYTHPSPIYILFNPWCLRDAVHLPGHEMREEYVLDDSGLMFRGTMNQIKPVPWFFAQYEQDILDCAMYLVREIGKVKGIGRNDPIRTARALAAAVNVQDDNGVLIGNWAKDPADYAGGTHPLKWGGSLNILQKFYERKKPVKYAQCWVYAGVLTTVCRALGIPCRPVTGYNAAHDSQGSLTIDIIKDDDGNTVEKFTRDSVWNYHVWNESWMERPDLGNEYAGWQVIDATPQETSDDMYRCGPASIHAVREGEVQRPYDVSYVFAEVNADKILWKYSGEIEPLKLIYRDTTSIGQRLSTKAIGQMAREDVTSAYKYPEASEQERSTMEKALRKSQSIFARYYLNDVFNEVEFDFELNHDIVIGQDFNVAIHMRNKSSSKKHQVQGVLRVDTVTYTGKTGENVKRQNFDVTLNPEDKEIVIMKVTFEEYFKKLVDQASFNIACLASIVDTKFDYFAQDDFRVRNPDIQISIQGQTIAGQQVHVLAKVRNPLPIPLKNARFYINSPGLDKQLKIDMNEVIGPSDIAIADFTIVPQWGGRHQISAKFVSKELRDVDGFLSFNVASPYGRSAAPEDDVVNNEIPLTATNGSNGIPPENTNGTNGIPPPPPVETNEIPQP